jgi:hypothetical protein
MWKEIQQLRKMLSMSQEPVLEWLLYWFTLVLPEIGPLHKAAPNLSWLCRGSTNVNPRRAPLLFRRWIMIASSWYLAVARPGSIIRRHVLKSTNAVPKMLCKMFWATATRMEKVCQACAIYAIYAFKNNQKHTSSKIHHPCAYSTLHCSFRVKVWFWQVHEAKNQCHWNRKKNICTVSIHNAFKKSLATPTFCCSDLPIIMAKACCVTTLRFQVWVVTTLVYSRKECLILCQEIDHDWFF